MSKSDLERLLDKYGLSEDNTVSTPTDLNVKLLKNDNYSKQWILTDTSL